MKMFNSTRNVKVKNALILTVGSLMFTIAVNMFVGPGGLYVGGVTGLLQIIIMFLYDFFDIELGLGVLVLLSNIPILLIGWKSVGRRFAVLTLFSVVLQSILFEVVPIYALADDMMINSIFGGVFGFDTMSLFSS